MTIVWTISPILFTNGMTSSYKYSVVSVNCLISQNPKIRHFFYPGIIGSISPDLTIFLQIISDPASPYPSASKVPILIIVFSINTASY